jgi:hypothetical protein
MNSMLSAVQRPNRAHETAALSIVGDWGLDCSSGGIDGQMTMCMVLLFQSTEKERLLNAAVIMASEGSDGRL